VLVARLALDIRLPLLVLGALLGLLAVSNLLLTERLLKGDARRGLSLGVILLDVALLTGLLFGSGGAANPFSAFYVVYVAMAALLFGAGWALALVFITSACFALLFLVPDSLLGPHAHHAATPMHLQGMWAAYVLSASFVAYFVTRVAQALRKRDRDLAELQNYAARVERVASVSTMAAGAAHELGSPLASIAVSATELSESLRARAELATLAGEARSIRTEVERCRGIIERLAAGAGQTTGEALEGFDMSSLAELISTGLSANLRERLVVRTEGHSDAELRFPPRALLKAVENLVRNAVEANTRAGVTNRVELRLISDASGLRVEIRDSGSGIAPAIRERLGEPFVTEKQPGSGMGLGVYLVARFAEELGGQLRYEQSLGGGTLSILAFGTNASSSSA
jgi:two-component system sensor histidine kinase RegB